MRYLAKVSYDGSKFNGFERLNDGTGVQNELERAIGVLAKKKVVVHGAGRTDKGAHAFDQAIHFDLDIDISLDKLKYALNRILNEYVSIQSIKIVSDDFHARHMVKEKTYVYKIYLKGKNPFIADYAYIINRDLDFELMRDASKLFIGRHDFKNFFAGDKDSSELVINSFEVYKSEEYITLEIKGKSFYRYMVRFIVGSLIDLGLGKCKYLDIKEALDKPNKEKNFSVAPPGGLYLTNIRY